MKKNAIFFIILFLFPSVSFGAWVANTSFETIDGSTAPTNGNTVTGTGDGTGWSATWTHNATYPNIYKYNNVVSGIPDGSWAVKVDTTGFNYEPYISRTLTTPVVSGRVSVRYRTDVDDRDQQTIRLYDGATRALYILLDQNTSNTGRKLLTNAGLLEDNSLTEGTWYTIDVDFDCTTDTFQVYKNGVQKGGSISFENAITNVTIYRLENGAASGFSAALGNIHYWDFITNGSASTAVLTNTINGATINGAIISK